MKVYLLAAIAVALFSLRLLAQSGDKPVVSLKDAISIAETAVQKDERFQGKFVIGGKLDYSRSWSRKSELCWHIDWARTFPPSPGSVYYVEVFMDKTAQPGVEGR
jgi:hypothetical protein